MKYRLSKTMTLLACSAAAFSFSPNPGGEGFQILLNDKVIVQRYGSNLDNVQTLQLNNASAEDKLTVLFFPTLPQ